MRIRLAHTAAAVLLVMIPLVAAQATSFAVLLGNGARSEEDRARDADRKPAELMAFAGVRQGAKIVELAPGGGYYTRLLSLAVGSKGHVYSFSNRPAPAVEAWAAIHPNVTLTMGQVGDTLTPGPVDIVWTTLNYHDFKNAKAGDGDGAQQFNALAFAALKPGGIYLVNDHEAAAGSGASVTRTLHRIESSAVIREVEAAGFKLDARSDLLRHPADSHTLSPHDPSVRGKTDQFVLRFRKPRK